MFPRQIQLWMYAAELGEAEAQYRLGRAYDRGEGVAKSHPLAIHWYERAAGQGHARAAHNLGLLLYKGPKDYPAALKWMTCSAEQGDARGQYNLACFNLRGVGTPVDINAALDWYAKAAAQGDLDAMLGLGLLGCANFQRRREYQSGMDWLWRAADAGQAQALYELGMIYLKGHGVVRDEKTAMDLLTRAVENGNEAALLVVKVQIGSVRPGVLSSAERIAWWKHAAGCGFRHAAFELGIAYRHGDCGVCDPEQAAIWLETAARQGHAKAQYLLGKLYHAGEGVLRSGSTALQWLQRSAEQKYYLALLVLGNSHWETGDWPNALAAYEKYAQLRPDEPHGWYGMGLVYQRRRQFAEASAGYRKTITWEVEHLQAWENLAECLRETLDFKEAAAARREAMRIGKAQKAA